MIVKIKLIYKAFIKPDCIFKKKIPWLIWPTVNEGGPLQPQVGMTLVLPEIRKTTFGGKEATVEESFRFYITHIVADLRDNDIVLVEKRVFYARNEISVLAGRLSDWGWLEEKS